MCMTKGCKYLSQGGSQYHCCGKCSHQTVFDEAMHGCACERINPAAYPEGNTAAFYIGSPAAIPEDSNAAAQNSVEKLSLPNETPRGNEWGAEVDTHANEEIYLRDVVAKHASAARNSKKCPFAPKEDRYTGVQYIAKEHEESGTETLDSTLLTQRALGKLKRQEYNGILERSYPRLMTER